MTNVWLQVLPYAGAAVTLVGQTFRVPELRSEHKQTLASLLIEVLTLLAICVFTAAATASTGIVRGALVGTLLAFAAIIVPRLLLSKVIARTCESCTRSGKLAIGICLLLTLFLATLALDWVLTSA